MATHKQNTVQTEVLASIVSTRIKSKKPFIVVFPTDYDNEGNIVEEAMIHYGNIEGDRTTVAYLLEWAAKEVES